MAYSVVTDHLGTPLQLHDGQGQVAWAAELSSYGQRRAQTEPTTDCPFRYQSQYEDQETGLYYNRFRYYAPESGQYISQDPIGLMGDNPILYGYATDVTSLVDPLGLSTQPGSIVTFTDKAGTTLNVNGYTNLSHLSDKQLESLYYANSGSGWGLSLKMPKGIQLCYTITNRIQQAH